MYQLAIAANQNHDYFPVFGTCLGFELLTVLAAAGNRNWLTKCNAIDVASSLDFTGDYAKVKQSRMLRGITQELFDTLRTANVTYNFHQKCLTPTNMSASGLDQFFNTLSTNVDLQGMRYVSLFEAKDFPIFGWQWHPEKNPYEWVNRKRHMNIPHNPAAIRVSQFFANFMVDEARKSRHRYAGDKELIYHWQPEYTTRYEAFTQMYFFKANRASATSTHSALLLVSLTAIVKLFY